LVLGSFHPISLNGVAVLSKFRCSPSDSSVLSACSARRMLHFFFFVLFLGICAKPAYTLKDSLSIAVVTDIHIGYRCNRDESFTYENCQPVRALTNAVNKINTLQLDGVIASGDIADWGLYEEFVVARKIFDNHLTVPWWPLFGNHDSWPYKKFNGTFEQTDSPVGDQYFAEIYGDILAGNYSKMNPTQAARYVNSVISGWPTQSCLNQDNKSVNSWFHNFDLSFPEFSDSFKILNLDWVARSAAWPSPGVGPQAELHDYECGTTDWLSKKLGSYEKDNKFFIFQHHPFHNVEILDPFGHNKAFNFTIDGYQLKRVQEILGEIFVPTLSFLVLTCAFPCFGFLLLFCLYRCPLCSICLFRFISWPYSSLV
jgi:hypothetical protein